MKKMVVIYESKYGFTKRYAEYIASALSCPIFKKAEFPVSSFDNYDTLIYGGGLYAGGVSGVSIITKNFDHIRSKNLILFTCGLADPNDSKNAAHLQESMDKLLSTEMKERIKIFHFRGGIDYTRLSFIHRTMMAMLRRSMLKKDPSELGAEGRKILETYGKAVDFTDLDSVRPLLTHAASN
ncbi:MAG: flavodoxin [Coprococcus sp.]|nr:flavodoxin [Coprococcus sp.]